MCRLLPLLALMLAACAPSPIAPPQPTADESGSALDRPIPLGQAVITEEFEIRVDGVTRPADQQVFAADPSNLQPEPGFEYMRIDLTVTCKLAEPCTYVFIDWRLDDTEQTRPQIIIRGFPEELGTIDDFPPGQPVAGALFFIVPQGEPLDLLIYETIDSMVSGGGGRAALLLE